MAKNSGSAEAWFARVWLRRGLAAWLLSPLSLLFYLLSTIRRTGYRLGWLKSERLPVPVIVVGNIFVGGTGKTPLTIWLVEVLRSAGYYPGVISRGHGSLSRDTHIVTSASRPEQVGDEPLLIAQRVACPVVVGRSRITAGRVLLRAFPEINVIVADDGLQHYALQRDIEIVLFDSRGVGNGWLLPAGPLRELVSRRRDFTVINTTQPLPAWATEAIRMQLFGQIAENLTDRSQKVSLSALADSREDPPVRFAAAAGIGSPQRFFTMLQKIGIEFESIPLPDHFDFVNYTFAQVSADIILITEKDAVKCRHIPVLANDSRLWVVPVIAQLDGMLAEQIVEKLRG